MQDDPEIAKYKAALKKRKSIEITPTHKAALFVVLAIGAGVGLSAWQTHAKKAAALELEAQESKASEEEAQQAAKRAAEVAAQEEVVIGPLRPLIKTYAELSLTGLKEGPIELARGRKVLPVDTYWLMADPKLRKLMEMPDEGEKRAALFLADAELSEYDGCAALARKPDEVGLVLLVRAVTAQIGVYEKTKTDAHETRYSFVAVTHPERTIVARFEESAKPDYVVTDVAGFAMGKTTGRMKASRLKAVLEDLFAGRTPSAAKP